MCFRITQKGGIDIKTNKFQDNPFVIYRIRAGLRQEDVAAMLGINRAAITNWETGRALPRAQLLPALARIYNCSIDDLVLQRENE